MRLLTKLVSRLAQLADVLLSAPQDRQVLTYDAAEGLWKNADPAGGGLSAVADDPAPRLGGNLDANGRTITDTAAGAVTLDKPLVLTPFAAVTPRTDTLASTATDSFQASADAGYLTVAGDGLALGSSDFTFGIGFKADSLDPDYQCIACIPTAGGGIVALYITKVDGTPVLQIRCSPSPEVAIAGATAVTTGWHYAKLTRTSGTWKLYLDGVQQGNAWTPEVQPTLDVAEYYIGANSQVVTSYPFIGRLDEIYLSSVADDGSAPEAEIIADEDTLSLLHCNAAPFADAITANTVTNHNSAALDTADKLFGAGSVHVGVALGASFQLTRAPVRPSTDNTFTDSQQNTYHDDGSGNMVDGEETVVGAIDYATGAGTLPAEYYTANYGVDLTVANLSLAGPLQRGSLALSGEGYSGSDDGQGAVSVTFGDGGTGSGTISDYDANPVTFTLTHNADPAVDINEAWNQGAAPPANSLIFDANTNRLTATDNAGASHVLAYEQEG